MRSVYRGKSYRINDLQDKIVQFFEAKGFNVKVQKDSERVISVMTSGSSSSKMLDVRLASEPNDSLSVNLERVEASVMMRNSPFPSMLGGGVLTLKWQRSVEILDSLEKEFWHMVDEFVSSS